jgi:hypothetical protein
MSTIDANLTDTSQPTSKNVCFIFIETVYDILSCVIFNVSTKRNKFAIFGEVKNNLGDFQPKTFMRCFHRKITEEFIFSLLKL